MSDAGEISKSFLGIETKARRRAAREEDVAWINVYQLREAQTPSTEGCPVLTEDKRDSLEQNIGHHGVRLLQFN